ncbi:MAG TPA: hypothetical protein DF613_10505 [Lachnospiraceae bacterium]|nr:hypothetical protein [Lachnospiraceae bacterium]
MKFRKLMAGTLAATMVVGSGMTVFASNTNTGDATGQGTLLPHVDKEITTVTLPTTSEVANVFNYTVDPEALIKDAGTLADGTGVTGNDEGVYFQHAGTAAVPGTASYTSTTNTGNYTVTVSDLTTNATYTYDNDSDNRWEDSNGDAATVTISITDDDNSGAAVTPAEGDTVTVSGATAGSGATYSNSSQAVEFKGQNSVDVDVTVVAAVEASAANANDITLVADDAALAASTTPALLMTLKVGTEEAKAITTSAGATAKAKIDGVPENFETVANANKFEYKVKSNADATKWKSATVQLSGKTNKVKVPTGDDAMTAPKIKLTWTVAKHQEAPAGPTLSNATANTSDEAVNFDVTFRKGTALTCTFTGLGDGVTLRTVTWGTTTSAMTSTTTNVPLNGAAFTINANMWGSAAAGDVKYIRLTTSDNKNFVVKVTIA